MTLYIPEEFFPWLIGLGCILGQLVMMKLTMKGLRIAHRVFKVASDESDIVVSVLWPFGLFIVLAAIVLTFIEFAFSWTLPFWKWWLK